jgi:TRAP-type C4-dicarboxylate transport system substrate-binding protein
MDFVEKESRGTIRIKPLWSGALLSSDMSMEELRHGVADVGLITPIYIRGGTHLIRIQSGFYSGVESVESQVALYRCLAVTHPQFERELVGLKVLAVQGGSLPGIVTREKPVRTLEDIKQLRLRAPTELLTVLQSLGADPVNMPMADVYSSMTKGVIDGVVAPADTFRALHFAEVAKYFNTLVIPRGAYPARAMNLKRWNSLSDDQRLLLEKSTEIWEAALAREIRLALSIGFDEAAKRGVVISEMPPEEQERFDAMYLRDAERNARALERFGIDGLAVFQTARASIKARDQIQCQE